jgi:hypothetical protein
MKVLLCYWLLIFGIFGTCILFEEIDKMKDANANARIYLQTC